MSALAGRRTAPDPLASPGSRSLALARRRVDQVAVLSAAGEVDLATAPALEREALRALHSAHGRLILDLSATTFMDLSGIRVVERLGRTAAALGGQLALVAVTPGVRLVLLHAPPQHVLVTDRMTPALRAISDLHR